MEHLPGPKLSAEETTSLPLIEFGDTVNAGDVPGRSARTLTVPHDTVYISTLAWLSLEDFCRLPEEASYPGSWDLGLFHLLARQCLMLSDGMVLEKPGRCLQVVPDPRAILWPPLLDTKREKDTGP